MFLFIDWRSKVFHSHVVTFCPSLAYLFVQSTFFWTLTLQTRIEFIVAFLKGLFGVSGNIACTETFIMSITTTFQRIRIGIEEVIHLWLDLISSAAVWFRVVIQLRLKSFSLGTRSKGKHNKATQDDCDFGRRHSFFKIRIINLEYYRTLIGFFKLIFEKKWPKSSIFKLSK